MKIVAGPLCGLRGVHSGMSAGEREIILLELLGRTVKVSVARDFLKPASI